MSYLVTSAVEIYRFSPCTIFTHLLPCQHHVCRYVCIPLRDTYTILLNHTPSHQLFYIIILFHQFLFFYLYYIHQLSEFISCNMQSIISMINWFKSFIHRCLFCWFKNQVYTFNYFKSLIQLSQTLRTIVFIGVVS